MFARPSSYARRCCTITALQLMLVAVPELAVAQSTPAAEAQDSPQARYRRATEAFKQERYEDARKILLSLWKEKPSYEVAKTLVQVEYNLGHHAAAAQYLSWVLANLSPRESQSNIDDFKASLEELRGQVTTAQVTVTPASATVTVDGEPIDMTKQPAEVFLDVGTHVIKAQLGDQVAEERVYAIAGQKASVDLKLTVADVAPAAPRASAAGNDPARDAGQEKSLVPVGIGLGLFVAGLGSGIGFRLAAESDYDRADELRSKNGSGGCRNGTALPDDCQEQRDANDSGDTKANISTAGFVVAGLAAAATATYWFWPESQSTQGGSSKVKVQALGGREGAFVQLSGNF